MEGKIIATGKRKMAVARATIKDGTGKITLNRIPHVHLEMIRRLMIEEPVRIAKENFGDFHFDIEVTMRGGGQEGQIEAARLSIAKAIVAILKKDDAKKAEQLRKAYMIYDKTLLVADIRRKEAYKPGDSKARAKRQKSYR